MRREELYLADLHADDAVANKVCALFGRAEVRDYVDLDAILASGRYTEHELLSLAADHEPGFSRSWFAEALSAIDRLPDRLFQPYDWNYALRAAAPRLPAHGPKPSLAVSGFAWR